VKKYEGACDHVLGSAVRIPLKDRGFSLWFCPSCGAVCYGDEAWYCPGEPEPEPASVYLSYGPGSFFDVTLKLFHDRKGVDLDFPVKVLGQKTDDPAVFRGMAFPAGVDPYKDEINLSPFGKGWESVLVVVDPDGLRFPCRLGREA